MVPRAVTIFTIFHRSRAPQPRILSTGLLDFGSKMSTGGEALTQNNWGVGAINRSPNPAPSRTHEASYPRPLNASVVRCIGTYVPVTEISTGLTSEVGGCSEMCTNVGVSAARSDVTALCELNRGGIMGSCISTAAVSVCSQPTRKRAMYVYGDTK
jgi:hypothetical protein